MKRNFKKKIALLLAVALLIPTVSALSDGLPATKSGYDSLIQSAGSLLDTDWAVVAALKRCRTLQEAEAVLESAELAYNLAGNDLKHQFYAELSAKNKDTVDTKLAELLIAALKSAETDEAKAAVCAKALEIGELLGSDMKAFKDMMVEQVLGGMSGEVMTADARTESGLTVKVKGNMPKNAALKVKELTGEDASYVHNDILGLWTVGEDTPEKLYAIDIEIELMHGITWQPGSALTVELDGIELMAGGYVDVYHVHEGADGAVVVEQFSDKEDGCEYDGMVYSFMPEDEAVANGTISFTTGSFSVYYVVSGPQQVYEPAVNFSKVAPLVKRNAGNKTAEAGFLKRVAMATMDIVLPSAYADEEPAGRKDADGLETGKHIEKNEWSDPGTVSDYTVFIEAYATGSEVTTVTEEAIPCDIILVLDRSQSMKNYKMNSYNKVTRNVTDSGTYYIKNGNSYTRVYYCSTCRAFTTNNNHYNHGNKTVKYKPDVSSTAIVSGATTTTTFYTVGTSVSRLEALRTAVNSFIDVIDTQAKGKDGARGGGDDVDHRIAIVSFAQNASIDQHITSLNNNSVRTLKNTINNLSTGTYTHSDYGMEYANTEIGNIFADAAISQEYAEGKRNLVVVMFTDGVPCTSGSTGNDFSNSAARGAIRASYLMKNNHDATVYTIGIFDGADASKAAIQNGDSDANKYMKLVSSNYPNANPGTNSNYANNTGECAVTDGTSYYLSAGDSSTLTDIFEMIGKEATSGGSSINLDSTSYVKDVLSDQFVLPEGADASSIKVYTMDCVGKNGDELTFNNKQEYAATVVIGTSEDGKQYIKVTNFDYGANWCGSEDNNGTVTYRGKKLMLEIPVDVKNGFIGGNEVVSNDPTSGVYDGNDDPVEELEQPDTDVEIMDITVVTPDRNVYLNGTLTNEQLLEGLTEAEGATTNDDVGITLTRSITRYNFNTKQRTNSTDTVTLDLSPEATNYGLDTWQTAYVDVTGENGGAFSEALTADTTYTVGVEVEPEKEGTVKGKNKNSTGNVYVYKPELTFEDTEVKYMKTAAENDSSAETWDDYYANNNYVSEAWKHGDTEAVKANMIGDEPTLTLTYADVGDDNFTSDGKVNKTDSIPVDVMVAIGTADVTGYTTFAHEICDFGGCDFDSSKEKFLLHIIEVTGKLTITKSGLVYVTDGDSESAVFEVTSKDDSTKKWTVVINRNSSTTITDLLAGDYTVRELDPWTWRYKTLEKQEVTVPGGGEGTAEFENEQDDPYWLGGDNFADNVFGKATEDGGNER